MFWEQLLIRFSISRNKVILRKTNIEYAFRREHYDKGTY